MSKRETPRKKEKRAKVWRHGKGKRMKEEKKVGELGKRGGHGSEYIILL